MSKTPDSSGLFYRNLQKRLETQMTYFPKIVKMPPRLKWPIIRKISETPDSSDYLSKIFRFTNGNLKTLNKFFKSNQTHPWHFSCFFLKEYLSFPTPCYPFHCQSLYRIRYCKWRISLKNTHSLGVRTYRDGHIGVGVTKIISCMFKFVLKHKNSIPQQNNIYYPRPSGRRSPNR